jgi:hypothetical protein
MNSGTTSGVHVANIVTANQKMSLRRAISLPLTTLHPSMMRAIFCIALKRRRTDHGSGVAVLCCRRNNEDRGEAK